MDKNAVNNNIVSRQKSVQEQFEVDFPNDIDKLGLTEYEKCS